MDKKTNFFKTVILLQFIPAFLLGLLILMNYRKQKLLNVRGFHPYEFNYGHAVPLIFFGVCFLVSILIVFLKKENVTEDEADIQKKVRQQNFWKFAFYCNVFFLIIIAVFAFGLYRKNPFIIDQPTLFYSLLVLRSLLIIILSLVTASFFLAAGIYWKSNKTLAIFILIFSFFIIAASFTYEVVFMGEFMNASENYINRRDEKGLSSDASETSEDYVEADNEQVDPEVEKSKLLSSWNSLIPDWGALDGKYDFYDVRILIGRSLDDHITESDYYYLVQYIDNIRENPDALYLGFENYRSVIYSVISPEIYRKANFDKIVDGLLLTYDDIGAENEKLKEIYNAMHQPYGSSIPNMDKYYSDFEKYFTVETIEKLQTYKFSNNADFKDTDIMWFYSFWARRNNEGNIKEIAIILNEIKEQYDANSNSDEE